MIGIWDEWTGVTQSVVLIYSPLMVHKHIHNTEIGNLEFRLESPGYSVPSKNCLFIVNSLAPFNFKSIVFKPIIQNGSLASVCEITLMWLPQNIITNEVGIGSGNGLMLSGNKPLSELRMTQIYVVILEYDVTRLRWVNPFRSEPTQPWVDKRHFTIFSLKMQFDSDLIKVFSLDIQWTHNEYPKHLVQKIMTCIIVTS